jgi:hypothetical protein
MMVVEIDRSLLPPGIELVIGEARSVPADPQRWYEAELGACGPVAAAPIGAFETGEGWPVVVVRSETAAQVARFHAFYRLDDVGVVAIATGALALLDPAVFATARVQFPFAVVAVAQVWADLEIT